MSENAEPCGCYCEPPVGDHSRILTTLDVQEMPYPIQGEMMVCWDCGTSFVDYIGLWILVGLFLTPHLVLKIVRSLRNDISCFDNKRYLSFAAIVSGRHVPAKVPWKRARALLPIIRALAKPETASAQTTHFLQCAYCKDPPLRYQAEMDCPDCGAFHHAACYWTHGGCSVYGCGSRVLESEPSVASKVVNDFGIFH
jgi:hypothetical protein